MSSLARSTYPWRLSDELSGEIDVSLARLLLAQLFLRRPRVPLHAPVHVQHPRPRRAVAPHRRLLVEAVELQLFRVGALPGDGRVLVPDEGGDFLKRFFGYRHGRKSSFA